MEILNDEKSNLVKSIFVLVIVLCLYFAVRTISEIKNYNNIPTGATAVNTISFDGTGEVSATPDLATISFTILENAKDMASAQTQVTTKETAVLAFLDKSGIAKSDIKTENYSSYPQYQYQNSVCPPQPEPVMQPQSSSGSSSGAVSGIAVYCPPGKQILTGYEVSEDVSVQIHDTTKAGEIVQGIGNIGISNMSGPNFSIENQDALQEQARQIAINDAKTKAKVLSADLGVNLVRIVNFTENGNNPIVFPQAMMANESVGSTPAPAPALPAGENKITSNVTITYEIR